MNPIFDTFGNEYWYNEEQELHRENEPAVVYIGGAKMYFVNGRKHREDGPAIDFKNIKEWYIDGVQYSEEEFLRIVKMKALL
jgi:hypothetical protein